MTDDYYEEKVIEEITPLGIKPGDAVGELPDPNATAHSNELSALAAASAANANKSDRAGGGGGGIYRAGGPTTIFGPAGWGPYSDGPLNAVRKSLLSRDGVSEENWMYRMATRVAEAGDEWAKWRKEGTKPGGGASAEGILSGMMGALLPVVVDEGKRKVVEREDDEGDEEEARGSVEVVAPTVKRRKVGFESKELPLGVYEPHTGLVLCESLILLSSLRFTSPLIRPSRYTTDAEPMGNAT